MANAELCFRALHVFTTVQLPAVTTSAEVVGLDQVEQLGQAA